MEKYLKLSDVMEELDRLVRTKQIEPVHINLDEMEKQFEKMSIKSSIGFKGAIRITQRLKNEYDNILEHGHHNVNKLYIEAMLDVLDEIEDEFKDLEEENNPLDLLVKPTVAEFNTGWIKAENELPQYYMLIVGRFTDGCELVWRAKDDDMQDIYTVYNTDKILTNLIDWIPMRKKEIKIGSV